MSRRISTPADRQAVDKLKSIVRAMDQAFLSPPDFDFPRELSSLPDAISETLPLIRRKRTVRFPFWKCVKAVDAELPRLHLIDHLQTMVDRATSIRPGPLVALSKMADARNLTETERLLFNKLVDHFKREPALAPNKVADFVPVLTKVQLPLYESVATPAFQKLHSDRTTKHLLGNLAYCAFVLEHKRWKADYFKPLCDLGELLLALENDDLTEQLGRVIIWDWPKVRHELIARKQVSVILRQREFRKLQRRKRNLTPTSMKSFIVTVER